MSKNTQLAFCALAYRPRELAQTSSDDTRVIVFAVKDEEQNLRFLVHPDWRTMVHKEHVDYIESLLNDFREIAKPQPETLFQQVSSLGIGPLVTHQVGLSIADYPSLLHLFSHFVSE